MLLSAIKAAILAGQEICKIYNSEDFSITQKQDNTPITEADRRANEIINLILGNTNIPVLSEEGKDIDYQLRKSWLQFWLVDPLDGTKEFIKRNGEFTVNIALIENQLPVLGVIYVPVKKLLYFATEQLGSYKLENITSAPKSVEWLKQNALRLPHTFPSGRYVVVASRSHLNPETQKYIELQAQKCPEYELISIGSSLKFCLIAEGKAHEYPRFGPTMEWDTAAGHAIVKFSGGVVIQADTNKELIYNKKSLTNPNFIAKSLFLTS